MKIYAVNGGPRKKHNTAKLLQAALSGAAAAPCAEAVETEMIHLYDLDFQGCMSCFACKRLGAKSYGRCGFKDALSPVLEKLSQADGIIFGSPIYFGNVTGKLRCLLERLLFAYLVYDKAYSTLAPKRMPTAFLYDMNVSREEMEQYGYRSGLERMEMFVGRISAGPQCCTSAIPISLTTTANTGPSGFQSRKKPPGATVTFRWIWRRPGAWARQWSRAAGRRSNLINRGMPHEQGYAPCFAGDPFDVDMCCLILYKKYANISLTRVGACPQRI